MGEAGVCNILGLLSIPSFLKKEEEEEEEDVVASAEVPGAPKSLALESLAPNFLAPT